MSQTTLELPILEPTLDKTLETIRRGYRDFDKSLEYPPKLYNITSRLVQGVLKTSFRREYWPVMLSPTMAVISGALFNVHGTYAGRLYGPQLITVLVGPPGSNKGAMRLAKTLGGLVDKDLLSMPRPESDNEYGDDFKYKVGLFVSADASSASLIDIVSQAGGPVVVFETEIDPFLGGAAQEWKDLSSMMRQASEHESWSVIRKSRQVHIERPHVAFVISGTPDQVKKLISSAENGLFSRIQWVIVNADDHWQSPKPNYDEVSPEEKIKPYAHQLLTLHQALRKRKLPLEFQLNTNQWGVFDSVWSGVKKQIRTSGCESTLDSVVHRSALAAFRMMMVETVLRNAEKILTQSDDLKTLEASDEAFEAGLSIAMVHFENAFRVHESLPSTTAVLTQFIGAEAFFDMLPSEFSRKQILEGPAKEFGIAERTVDKYLSQWVKSGRGNRHPHKHGYYQSQSTLTGVTVGFL